MTRDIRPLEPADLAALSRFLTAGFHTAADAEFAAADVLAWKYLAPRGEPDDDLPRSLVARNEHGTLIGHVGICRTAFQGRGLPESGVTTLHMIDWLGSPGQPAVGASLMRRAHESTATQFGLGGSDAGRTVIRRGGYQPRPPVAVYQRVLRPLSWLRAGLPRWEQAARLTRDALALCGTAVRAPSPRPALWPRAVAAFGTEIEPIVRAASEAAVLTGRSPARLNHLLRYPRQTVSGWQLLEPSGGLAGFALLHVVPPHQGRVRRGKIVDLVLSGTDVSLWRAAILALTRELAHQGVDVAETFGSTPWMAEGLRRAGYRPRFTLEFSLRDRQGLIPPQSLFHLTPIEADYAYT